jgi:hypothetical protein
MNIRPEKPAFSSPVRWTVRQNSCYSAAENHDYREKARPETGPETGLGHTGVRAPVAGTSGHAWSNSRKDTVKFLCEKERFTLLAVSYFFVEGRSAISACVL